MHLRVVRDIFHRQWPAFALVVVLGGVSAAVQALTPAALLATPARPLTGDGDPRVRTGTTTYPRVARGADDVDAAIARPPRRIVSQQMASDEFLYTVVPPARVVGVSETAYRHALSNVEALVERDRPVVAIDPEVVLRARPDLVITSMSALSDMPSLIRAAGVPVYRMHTLFETLAAVEDHIRLFGYLTGEDARAAGEVRRFRDAVARAAARRPPGQPPLRVLGVGGAYSYGARTLVSDILRVLGAENVAAAHGFVGYDRVTDEHIVRWDPDWIVAGADRGTVDAVRARLLANPAIAATSAARHGHVIVLEHPVFLPLSPFTARLVEALAEAFYGEVRS
jgi:iron complex transport system substrate-binding protein